MPQNHFKNRNLIIELDVKCNMRTEYIARGGKGEGQFYLLILYFRMYVCGTRLENLDSTNFSTNSGSVFFRLQQGMCLKSVHSASFMHPHIIGWRGLEIFNSADSSASASRGRWSQIYRHQSHVFGLQITINISVVNKNARLGGRGSAAQ